MIFDNDYELLMLVRSGNEEAVDILCKKYLPVITLFSSKYYAVAKFKGLEFSDLKQEGLLALNEAMKVFNDDNGAKFSTLASICIERAIRRLLNFANTNKNKILNDAISFEYEDAENGDGSLEFLVCDQTYDPENVFFNIEDERNLYKLAKEVLTDLEYKIFWLKAENYTNQEIVVILRLDYKVIDNGLERIKRKLKNGLSCIE